MHNRTVTGMETDDNGRPQLHYFIKEWMDERGISDDEMGEKMGVARETVYRRRTEQKRLSPSKVAEFAYHLGIEVSELQYRPGVPSLDALARDASIEQRKMAADIIQRLMSKE